MKPNFALLARNSWCQGIQPDRIHLLLHIRAKRGFVLFPQPLATEAAAASPKPTYVNVAIL
jgi:hypothetical protein